MLQRQAFQEQLAGEDYSQFLTPSHIFDVVKRRWLHFTIPFVLLSAIGGGVALFWPAVYLAEGKILVESPQIPSDLVTPTIAILANERIQIIQQRIMTRDNLLALAKKFGVTTDWQDRVSGTELVDFIRSRTDISPFDISLSNPTNKKKGPNTNNNAIAFTVGFTYEQPDVAVKVVNELMTMILNEDVRGRTNSATEATRFLSQEVNRLEGQIKAIDTRISTLSQQQADADAKSAAVNGGGSPSAKGSPSSDMITLAKLKAELLVKSATLSDEHPDIKALKRRVDAFEKANDLANAKGDTATAPADASQNPAPPATPQVTIDSLTTQKANLNVELSNVTKKLATARLGENLERGQYAERLQVIEQPTLPDKPVRPNRPKIFALAFVFAVMASGGLVFAQEILNPAIRRSSDLYSIIDSHLIVSIPYIVTLGEKRRKKKKIILTTGIFATVVVAGLIAVLFILPPLDVLFAKFTARLLG